MSRLANSYLARRLLTLVPVWIGISLLAFFIGHLAPGDPGVAILSGELGRPPTPAELQGFDRGLGIDRPLVVQYLRWLRGVLHGDFGRSYRTGQGVVGFLQSRFPATAVLVVVSMVLVLAVAIPLGTWAGVRAARVADSATRVVSVASAALPSFWVGYLLIVTFAVHWHALPAQGNRGWRALLMPAITLAFATVGVPLRLVRTAVVEVMGEEYVRTARAVGTPPRRLVSRHILRNALGPIVTYAGVVFAGLLGTTVIVETVFAWPGIGLVIDNAIHARDYPVVQGFVLLVGTLCVLVNLGADVLVRSFDPRIRLGAAADAGHG